MRLRASVCLSLLAISLVAASACSESKSTSSPTAPTPTPTPTIVPPANVHTTAINIRDRAAAIEWIAATGATSYVVEVGTAKGASDFAVITTKSTATSLTLTDLPGGGEIFVRVRAQNSTATSQPSPELAFYLQDYKYFIEALFLGTGPYGNIPPEPPYDFDGVRGYPPGTSVRIRLSNTITGEQRRGVETVAAQLGSSGARYGATIEVMNSDRAAPSHNEIDVVTLDNACGTGLGCFTPSDTSLKPDSTGLHVQIFGAGSLFFGTSGSRGDAADVSGHETGHALFGLRHIRYQNIPEAPQFTSQFGLPPFAFPSVTMFYSVEPSFRASLVGLSDLEMQAVQDVFRSGIAAGSSRADMRVRGLIH
jgi:hypothetical protein